MKKIVAFVLCMIMVFSVSLLAFATPTVKLNSQSGKGQGTSYYHHVWASGKQDYILSIKCSVEGVYRIDPDHPEYTKSGSASGKGQVGKSVDITARCNAKYSNHECVRIGNCSKSAEYIDY